MNTYRVYLKWRRPGEPKTRLIHADQFQYGNQLVFYNVTGDQRDRVACFSEGTWSWVKRVGK